MTLYLLYRNKWVIQSSLMFLREVQLPNGRRGLYDRWVTCLTITNLLLSECILLCRTVLGGLKT